MIEIFNQVVDAVGRLEMIFKVACWFVLIGLKERAASIKWGGSTRSNGFLVGANSTGDGTGPSWNWRQSKPTDRDSSVNADYVIKRFVYSKTISLLPTLVPHDDNSFSVRHLAVRHDARRVFYFWLLCPFWWCCLPVDMELGRLFSC